MTEPQDALRKVRDYLIRLAAKVTKPTRYGFQTLRRDRDNGDIEYQIFADTKGHGTQIAYVQSTKHDADFIAACLAQAPLFGQLLADDASLRARLTALDAEYKELRMSHEKHRPIGTLHESEIGGQRAAMLSVPSGTIVEIDWRHPNGAVNFWQIRDHGGSQGIDKRGDVVDVLEAKNTALRHELHKSQRATSLLRDQLSDAQGVESELRTELAQVRQERDKLRSALAALVGASDRAELEQLEIVMRMLDAPAADKAVSIDAIHALLESAK